MPLVNTWQIPQDLKETSILATSDMYKTAGMNFAYAHMGLTPSELEKTAWVMPALKAVGGLFRNKAVQGAAAAAKPTGLWARTGGRLTASITQPFSNFGKNVTQAVGSRLGARADTIAKVQGLGKGMVGEGLGFGAISGGINAAMADPGQRGEAFARGFGGGVLGGMAWRGAGNVASAGLKRGLGKHFAGLEATAKQPWFGKLQPGQSRLKGWGSKAVLGGVPFAAGMAASSYTPTFDKEQSPYAQRGAQLGASMAPYMNASPSGYGFNPNLPLPQNRY